MFSRNELHFLRDNLLHVVIFYVEQNEIDIIQIGSVHMQSCLFLH